MLAPKFWPVERKTKKYVVEPRPGPHSKYASIPMVVMLRDIMKFAFNVSEAKKILRAGQVLVDGRIRKEIGFPLGFMDVITIGSDHYRVLVNNHGLRLATIDKRESEIKLLRVEGKTLVKKGRVQLHLHDGRNMLLDKNSYKTGDVIVFDLAGKKVKDIIKLENGTKALIMRGNNMGVLGTIEEIIVTKNSMPNQVVVDIGSRKIDLPQHYIFVVGKGESVIKIGD